MDAQIVPHGNQVYRPELCEKLIAHMAEGGSFTAFAAKAGVTRKTLYEWLKDHEEFAFAKEIGTTRSLDYYERLGKALATGQLVRITKEEPVLDKDGNVVFDPNGNPVTRKEYGPAPANVTAWIFMMKNMHGWRDRQDISILDPGDQGRPLREVERDKLLGRYQELVQRAMEKAIEAKSRKTKLASPAKQK